MTSLARCAIHILCLGTQRLLYFCRKQLTGLKGEVVAVGDEGMICRNLLEEDGEEEGEE